MRGQKSEPSRDMRSYSSTPLAGVKPNFVSSLGPSCRAPVIDNIVNYSRESMLRGRGQYKILFGE